MEASNSLHRLQEPLELPCGAVLKNRVAKSPMSDSLGDGEGNPTESQIRLYERWAHGGTAVSFIGEVQGDPRFPERPGNLVLGKESNLELLRSLTKRALVRGAHLWPQIGHAGALSHKPISVPKGPSPIDVGTLQCSGMSVAEIQELPRMYARTALYAKTVGFSGVHIHAGHGFLLSQFLSPLFNRRTDGYGGSIKARCRVIVEILDEVRRTVGPSFPVGIRINASDKLEGGLTEIESLEVVRLLDQTSIDLIDISGGTYFPGAKAYTNNKSGEPYFLDFARRTKDVTKIPLMLTGGFKNRSQAIHALETGAMDVVGLARAMVLRPNLPDIWIRDEDGDPVFPKFDVVPPGGVTAWYTMLLTALGENRENTFKLDPQSAIDLYEKRDAQRCITWQKTFSRYYE